MWLLKQNRVPGRVAFAIGLGAVRNFDRRIPLPSRLSSKPDADIRAPFGTSAEPRRYQSAGAGLRNS